MKQLYKITAKNIFLIAYKCIYYKLYPLDVKFTKFTIVKTRSKILHFIVTVCNRIVKKKKKLYGAYEQ